MKISLKLPIKPLLQCFFSDHLNHKTVNKTTCRMPSENPRQLWAHQLRSFGTVAIIFWGFQVYLVKYFWSLLVVYFRAIYRTSIWAQSLTQNPFLYTPIFTILSAKNSSFIGIRSISKNSDRSAVDNYKKAYYLYYYQLNFYSYIPPFFTIFSQQKNNIP